ncbi:multidrug ABC transporter ATP-binding protein [Staphylococcus saprophyticus]|jgi:ABC-2 type transport system ATP-binding protein|uniref:Putative ABC transporter ATP-binding protein n=1 Tax=Staphylococcus saprophyticus subsp. saprophyticus (strain ATCC 15305 / DSM 20229 / NCIMB 8711 / NCTC 7292 / S-41) TaxID=342451 RepID=Q4A0N4_STAS1|nr:MULTISPECIES: ATP-binding cassette domain-containing protein [Staphylococcus]CRV26396.1 ABC transporter ATP-binding protein [Streptococcus equi subsp. equi]SIN54913.1 ABC-type multidrug transport system, ATPase component [Mycobacteroides abscessus subsp. abscessus]AMG19331.1 multidrug ABC transporter ATP-binding protein [Staphylococcus saprophyticus]AMG32443.1 multidrug ABC transporter ATP-binding protein [Staphylococcus saprophyticus]ASF19357.2 multidrug ABC transporter ATP-binding protein
MIELKNLSKHYRKKCIFESLDMTFENLQLTVLLGENGAGKSTLLRMIAGLEQLTKGEIRYFGEQLSKKQRQDKIGYVPQDIALFEHMTVNENIRCFKALCKTPLSNVLIDEYARQLNLNERTMTISNLSGGTKRKVNVLIGLLSNPQILILDEPTVGIDLKSRFDIHNLLNTMKRERLIILTTHHLDEVEALADQIKVIGNDPFYREILEDKHWAFEVYNNK